VLPRSSRTENGSQVLFRELRPGSTNCCDNAGEVNALTKQFEGLDLRNAMAFSTARALSSQLPTTLFLENFRFADNSAPAPRL